MFDWLAPLFDTSQFPARWSCGNWSATHGWTHILADLAIFGAYAAVSMVITAFVRLRSDIPYLPIFALFAAFVLSCGIGHLIEATLFWHPWYALSGASKVVTAVVSWATVIAMVAAMPQALALRGPVSKAEQAARENAERFEALVRTTSNLVWTTDEHGEVSEVSASWLEFTGQTADESRGWGWLDAVHPDDRAMTRQRWSKATERTEPYTNEYRLRERSGEWRWMAVRACPLFHPDRTVRGWVGMNVDIQDRKAAEQQLRETNAALETRVAQRSSEFDRASQRLRDQSRFTDAILTSISEGVIVTNRMGGFLQFNPAAQRILGCCPPDVSPEQWSGAFRLFLPDGSAPFPADKLPMRRAMEGEATDEVEIAVRPDEPGNDTIISMSGRPLLSGDGALIGGVVVLRDITARKHVEARLLASLEEKRVLLREIHHRVKNNLAVIGSLFYLQSSYTRDEGTLRVLSNCQDRVRSMGLVHESLYRSQDLSSVDFADYVKQLAQHLSHSYALRPGAIRWDYDLEHVALTVERAIPCGLIVNELLANALKHGFPDGRTGTIQVMLRERDGRISLRVADDGVGLPPDAHQDAGRSLGMRLVEMLTKQIDATLACRSGAGDVGTEISLTMETVPVHGPMPEPARAHAFGS